MHSEYYKYIYEGPVMSFDKCMIDCWKGETIAPTLSKARSNFSYQAKKLLNITAGGQIKLPGKIKMVN